MDAVWRRRTRGVAAKTADRRRRTRSPPRPLYLCSTTTCRTSRLPPPRETVRRVRRVRICAPRWNHLLRPLLYCRHVAVFSSRSGCRWPRTRRRRRRLLMYVSLCRGIPESSFRYCSLACVRRNVYVATVVRRIGDGRPGRHARLYRHSNRFPPPASPAQPTPRNHTAREWNVIGMITSYDRPRPLFALVMFCLRDEIFSDRCRNVIYRACNVMNVISWYRCLLVLVWFIHLIDGTNIIGMSSMSCLSRVQFVSFVTRIEYFSNEIRTRHLFFLKSF